MRSDLFFVVSRDLLPEKVHHVATDEAFIGRGLSNNLCLPHDSVSRRHAVVVRTVKGFIIRDLGSRNGTHLNGRTITEGSIDGAAVLQIGPYSLAAYNNEEEALRATLDRDASTSHGEMQSAPELNELESQLTNAQRRVYDALMSGQSEKEVACLLRISVHTVHSHARVIYAKFSVCSRPELFSLWLKRSR